MMVFFAGTWQSPWFYHVTEKYDSLLIFISLVFIFFGKVRWTEKLRQHDRILIVMVLSLAVAVINLFI